MITPLTVKDTDHVVEPENIRGSHRGPMFTVARSFPANLGLLNQTMPLPASAPPMHPLSSGDFYKFTEGSPTVFCDDDTSCWGVRATDYPTHEGSIVGG